MLLFKYNSTHHIYVEETFLWLRRGTFVHRMDPNNNAVSFEIDYVLHAVYDLFFSSVDKPTDILLIAFLICSHGACRAGLILQVQKQAHYLCLRFTSHTLTKVAVIKHTHCANGGKSLLSFLHCVRPPSFFWMKAGNTMRTMQEVVVFVSVPVCCH